jgi:hypothetical protein
MKAKPESASLTFARSLSIGLLLSILVFYAFHLFGTWKIENYRPDPETTGTVLLHNECLVFGNTHTLRPNTDVSGMDDSIDGTKLGGSFMIFFEGHIIAIIILSLFTGGAIFYFRLMRKKSQQRS